MIKLLITFLLLLSPIVSADMDKVCTIFAEDFADKESYEISEAIKEQGCVRNNILQVIYSKNTVIEDFILLDSGRWCRFDRNRDIRGSVLSCVLYSTKPRERLDLIVTNDR